MSLLIDSAFDGAFMQNVRYMSKTAGLLFLVSAIMEPRLIGNAPVSMWSFVLICFQYISLSFSIVTCVFISTSPVRGIWFTDKMPEPNFSKLLHMLETAVYLGTISFTIRIVLSMYGRGFPE